MKCDSSNRKLGASVRTDLLTICGVVRTRHADVTMLLKELPTSTEAPSDKAGGAKAKKPVVEEVSPGQPTDHQPLLSHTRIPPFVCVCVFSLTTVG